VAVAGQHATLLGNYHNGEKHVECVLLEMGTRDKALTPGSFFMGHKGILKESRQ
jgi:hypothetical protein